jgi:hypothetical protein
LENFWAKNIPKVFRMWKETAVARAVENFWANRAF